jgi:hypothetical protein
MDKDKVGWVTGGHTKQHHHSIIQRPNRHIMHVDCMKRTHQHTHLHHNASKFLGPPDMTNTVDLTKDLNIRRRKLHLFCIHLEQRDTRQHHIQLCMRRHHTTRHHIHRFTH